MTSSINNDPMYDWEKWFIVAMTALLLICLCSCRSSKSSTSDFVDITTDYSEYVLQQQAQTDSLVRVIRQRDSLVALQKSLIEKSHTIESRDSVIVRDSVVIREMPDGSRVEQYYRYETQIRNLMRTIQELSQQETYLAQWHESQDSCLLLSQQVTSLRDSLTFITDSIAEHRQMVTKEKNHIATMVTNMLLITAFLLVIRAAVSWVSRQKS